MSEETQVAVVANAALPAVPVEHDDTGLDDIVRLKPSRIALVQNTTLNPRGADPGQFLDTTSGDVFDKVDVVIMKMRKGRVFFKPGEKISSDSEPLCRSSDGVKPEANVKARQSQQCNGCPRSKWIGDTPPPCKEKIELVVSKTDNQMPYYMSVGGKSISPIRKTLEAIKSAIYGDKMKGLPTTLHNFILTFSSEKDGSYFKMKAPKILKMTEENAAPYKQMYEEMKSVMNVEHEVEAETAVDESVSNVIEGEIVEEVQEV